MADCKHSVVYVGGRPWCLYCGEGLPDAPACAHRTRTHGSKGQPVSPTRCFDCGTDIGCPSPKPSWEVALYRRLPRHVLEDWGYAGIDDWAPEGTLAFRTSGHLAAWMNRADITLDAACHENIRRIQEIAAFVNLLAAGAPAARSNELRFAILAWAATSLVNAMFARAGAYDAMIAPKVQSTHPFSGYRAALFACFHDDAPTLSPGAYAPSGNEATTSLPHGPLFGGVTSVSPSHAGTSTAPGAARIDARDAVRRAIFRTRLNQEHTLVPYHPPPRDVPPHLRADYGRPRICANCLNLAEEPLCLNGKPHKVYEQVHPGTEPLTALHLELLELVDVGARLRSSACIEDKTDADGYRRRTVIPAIDTVRLREAVEKLRRPELNLSTGRRSSPYPDLSEGTAKAMLRAARTAIIDQLRVDGLIPPRGPRGPAPQRATTPQDLGPFALPGRA